MAIVTRPYIDGVNTPRSTRVEDNGGAGDDFIRIDPGANAKLDTVNTNLVTITQLG
jgi:hypothetical protein